PAGHTAPATEGDRGAGEILRGNRRAGIKEAGVPGLARSCQGHQDDKEGCALVLLSQKVATNDEENHLFGKIHTSAMGGWNGSAKVEGWCSTIFRVWGGAHERYWACGPGQAASRLLLGFDDALRAQERGADGSDHSTKTDRGPASVASSFYRRGRMVGRE